MALSTLGDDGNALHRPHRTSTQVDTGLHRRILGDTLLLRSGAIHRLVGWLGCGSGGGGLLVWGRVLGSWMGGLGSFEGVWWC
ncbi:hypothetical protein ES702_03713 [subsurface metagenome]